MPLVPLTCGIFYAMKHRSQLRWLHIGERAI